MAYYLVTGAMGFSGSTLTRQLLEDGKDVIAMDRAQSFEGMEERFKVCKIDPANPKLTLLSADLLDPDSLKQLNEYDISHVFHVASLYDYSATREALMAVNVEGTRNLLSWALEADLKRFVHWSTCGVFGKPYTAAEGKKHNLPFDEKASSPKNTAMDAEGPDGTHLVNVYSESKWIQEKLLWKAYADNGLPLTVIRPAPIYGRGSRYGHGGIMLLIAKGLLRAIPSDAKNAVTTSVHVEDVAGFARFVIEKKESIGEDYNVVDDSIISYRDFLHYIALVSGRRLWNVPGIRLSMYRAVAVPAAQFWTWLERKFNFPKMQMLEVQSATYIGSSYWISNRKSKELGYQYRYPDVREGVRDTLAWFRETGDI
ncbi:MAG: hypothetical protein CMH54_10935 [Myxococcales bacterium]|nr:hypothetical protein [Myxococcales bacterium]